MLLLCLAFSVLVVISGKWHMMALCLMQSFVKAKANMHVQQRPPVYNVDRLLSICNSVGQSGADTYVGVHRVNR